MKYYPVSMDLRGKRCIVVGGGRVAQRRIATLLDHGAQVRMVSPIVTDELRTLATSGKVTWVNSAYKSGHLDGAFLVVAATDLRQTNATVVADAHKLNLLVTSVDAPEEGNFISPAQVVRGDLAFTISTSGLSPTLASVLREDIEAAYGPEWAELTRIVGRVRHLLKERHASEEERRAAIRTLLSDEGVWDAIREGNLAEAEALARRCL
jgi:precorrin-2 dehydrogenase/sirohydrochlorin ferrochelatase